MSDGEIPDGDECGEDVGADENAVGASLGRVATGEELEQPISKSAIAASPADSCERAWQQRISVPVR